MQEDLPEFKLWFPLPFSVPITTIPPANPFYLFLFSLWIQTFGDELFKFVLRKLFFSVIKFGWTESVLNSHIPSPLSFHVVAPSIHELCYYNYFLIFMSFRWQHVYCLCVTTQFQYFSRQIVTDHSLWFQASDCQQFGNIFFHSLPAYLCHHCCSLCLDLW